MLLCLLIVCGELVFVSHKWAAIFLVFPFAKQKKNKKLAELMDLLTNATSRGAGCRFTAALQLFKASMDQRYCLLERNGNTRKIQFNCYSLDSRRCTAPSLLILFQIRFTLGICFTFICVKLGQQHKQQQCKLTRKKKKKNREIFSVQHDLFRMFLMIEIHFQVLCGEK